MIKYFFKRNIVENLTETTPFFLSVIMNSYKFLKNPILLLSISRNRNFKIYTFSPAPRNEIKILKRNFYTIKHMTKDNEYKFLVGN